MTENSEEQYEKHKVVIVSGYGNLSAEAVEYLMRQPEARHAVEESRREAEEYVKDLENDASICKKEKFKMAKDYFYDGIWHWIERDNPALIRCVEKMGVVASAPDAGLEIVEVRGDKYRIAYSEVWDGETVETPYNCAEENNNYPWQTFKNYDNFKYDEKQDNLGVDFLHKKMEYVKGMLRWNESDEENPRYKMGKTGNSSEEPTDREKRTYKKTARIQQDAAWSFAMSRQQRKK